MPANTCTSRRAGLLLTTLILFPVLSGCAHRSYPVSGSPAPDQQADVPSLSTELAQLDVQAVPPGSNPVVYSQLKEELRQMLEQKQGSALAPAPPTNDRSRTQLTWNAESSTLSWYYFNNGDYDQNGEINVSDLTPLGIHYGKTADEITPTIFDQLVSGPANPPFGRDAIEAVVDGDANGSIGISDITPLGQNFWRSVSGYRIYAGTEGADYPAANAVPSTLTPLAEITFSEALGPPGGGRLQFSYTVPEPVAGMSYWVRPVFGGVEGTPSNVAGAGLSYAPGQLSLTGVSPVSAEPGELIWLQFNAPLAGQLEGLTIVVDGYGDAAVEVAALAVNGNVAGTGAPLLAPGPVSIAAFQNGSSIGTVQLILTAPTTEMTETECAQMYNTAITVLDEVFTDYFVYLNSVDPAFDTTAADVELTEFNQALEGVVELFLEELAALNRADQQVVLGYLVNSGYFELLDALQPQPPEHWSSRTTSRLSMDNWDYLHLDMWSAAYTNNSVIFDAVGLSIAVLTSGGVEVPVLALAKAILGIFDNAIDTFLPTDLYDLRLETATRYLESGTDQPFTVQGRFAAEKPALGGTIELFVEAAMAGLKLPKAAKDALLAVLLSDIQKKIGTKLITEFWNLILPPVSDPDDPCYGRIGGNWIRLDLHLYSSIDWDVLSESVMYGSFTGWSMNYPSTPVALERSVGFEVDYAAAASGRYNDYIHFNHPGKYTVTLTGFTFNDTQSVLLFWAHTSLKEVVREIPFWVGRWGDWRNTILSESTPEWNRHFMQVVNETPVCVYYSWPNYHAVHAMNEQGTEWSPPVTVFAGGEIKDMVVINGLPAVLCHIDNSEWQLLIANDNKGSTWPATGVEIANTPRCLGTVTWGTDNYILVDDAASFVASGVESGNWVELTATGDMAQVLSVLSETQLRTSNLSGGASYTPGTAYEICRNDVRTSQCRLGVKGGVPMLIYWKPAGGDDTFFVSALDMFGEEWNEPVLCGQDAGKRTAPLIAAGVPAYATADYIQGIYYRQAFDSSGYGWRESSKIADGTDNLLSFNVIAGVPAMCLTAMVSIPAGAEVHHIQELYYTAAADSTGGDWLSPVALARALDEPDLKNITGAALATVNGHPGVAFYHYNGMLGYSEALDSSGLAWSEPVAVSYGNVGSIYVCDFNHKPAVCHYSAPDYAMMWSVPDL